MRNSNRIKACGIAACLFMSASQLHAAGLGLTEWYGAAGDSLFEKMNAV